MSDRTEISITIDTEFSIAGAFSKPDIYKPVAEPLVHCEVKGEEQGLGFLLDTFEKYNISASFFVECANYFYFGDDPMQGIVKRIMAAGQDVQLHVHPVWLYFDESANFCSLPVNDNCTGRGYSELKEIFESCIKVFERWTGKRPEALRTGSLVADLNIYQVMKELDIPLASNVAIGVSYPEPQELHLFGGRKYVEGVLEVPVYSYLDMNFLGRKSIKSLQITSCSWPEMRYILWQARKYGLKNVVILTHPFEYIKSTDFQYKKITRNRINQGRLEKLCEFINMYNQDFVSADFGSSCERWHQNGEVEQKLLDIPVHYMMGRKIHNKINDSIWNY